jgi:hypothetical protein
MNTYILGLVFFLVLNMRRNYAMKRDEAAASSCGGQKADAWRSFQIEMQTLMSQRTDLAASISSGENCSSPQR